MKKDVSLSSVVLTPKPPARTNTEVFNLPATICFFLNVPRGLRGFEKIARNRIQVDQGKFEVRAA